MLTYFQRIGIFLAITMSVAVARTKSGANLPKVVVVTTLTQQIKLVCSEIERYDALIAKLQVSLEADIALLPNVADLAFQTHFLTGLSAISAKIEELGAYTEISCSLSDFEDILRNELSEICK